MPCYLLLRKSDPSSKILKCLICIRSCLAIVSIYQSITRDNQNNAVRNTETPPRGNNSRIFPVTGKANCHNFSNLQKVKNILVTSIYRDILQILLQSGKGIKYLKNRSCFFCDGGENIGNALTCITFVKFCIDITT